MTNVAVIGAGGKMGYRVCRNLRNSEFNLVPVEVGEAGIQRLGELGLKPVPSAEALAKADAVVLAVPDTILGKVADEVAAVLPSGKMLVILDIAAPLAGHLPTNRPDLTFFATHPCHPPIFNDETDPEARNDHHGGIAKQAIVSALLQGPDEHFELGERIAKVMYAPVTRSHRVTAEQMAILEPGLSEMIAMPFIDIMAKAIDECERLGVPREAAHDFLMGHLNVEIAMWMGKIPLTPSQAAFDLLAFAQSRVVKENWREVLQPDVIREAVSVIVNGGRK